MPRNGRFASSMLVAVAGLAFVAACSSPHRYAGPAWQPMQSPMMPQPLPYAPAQPSSSPIRMQLPVNAEAVAVRDRTLSSSQALEHVTSIVDEVGPRLAGSEAEPKAVAWAVARMKRAGLVDVHTEPVKEVRWVRGQESAEMTSPTKRKLAVTTLGGSVPTREKGVEAEVLEVQSMDELAQKPDAEVKGKIVYFHVVMQRARDGSGYGKAVPARTAGPSAAAKKGALAVVVRSMSTAEDRAPHTGALHYVDGVNKIPAAALGVADAELLHRAVQDKKKVKLKLVLLPQELSPADGANVIGDVPGASQPQEIVLIGAHLDSWEPGMGALDDGAGLAIVLEAGRQIALARTKPKRTVRVVFFANEENGLAGAKAYAKAHEAELSKHVAASEADFGDGRVYEATLLAGPGHERALFDDTWLLLPLGAVVGTKPAEGGADISPLRAAGVPIFDLRQDGTHYFDVHHSENDVLEKITKADLDQAAAAFAAITYSIADRATDLGRVPEASREHKY